MRISVSGDPTVDLSRVRRAVRTALRPYALPRDVEIALAFIDDAAMRELNRRHRRKDKTTDVLSFGQQLPRRARGASAVSALDREPDGTLELGDIVISAAQATRQAKRRGHSREREIAFLAAHGALHLLGFEDDTMAGYREMAALGTAAVAEAFARPRH